MTFPADYFKETLTDLLAIDSPTGFTHGVIQHLRSHIEAMGYPTSTTHKGNLMVKVKGKTQRPIGVSAHVDTLGLVVKGYKGNGTLSFSRVGGPIIPTLDGEYCRIYTRCGKVYTGTILSNSPSSHVYEDAGSKARNLDTMHIRLDELVKNKDDVIKLGIQAGDFICYEPKTVITPSGFIKSRFLDDKLSVALILTLLRYYKDEGIQPEHTVTFMFSTYEEVGHGLSHLPEAFEEVLALDMGCIGDDLNCTEEDVSICAKDSTGPYDYHLTSRLIGLAKNHGLNYAVDVYPMYGSDVSAARAGGNDFVGALIGAGVAASHGMERSHMKGAENTWKLLYLYTTT